MDPNTVYREGQENARAAASRNIEAVKVDPFGNLGINKSAPAAAQAAAGQSGDAYLSTLPAAVAAQVKALAEGRLQMSPMTLRTPQGQALIQMAMQYEPGTDQTTYMKRAATAKDAASGKLATSNNALNTVAGHLADLADAADALHNSSVPLFNTVANAVSNAMGEPRGNTPTYAASRLAEARGQLFRRADESATVSLQSALAARVRNRKPRRIRASTQPRLGAISAKR